MLVTSYLSWTDAFFSIPGPGDAPLHIPFIPSSPFTSGVRSLLSLPFPLLNPPPFPPADLGGCQLIHAFFLCLAFDEWIVGKYAISAPSEVRSMLVLYIPEELVGGGGAGISDDGNDGDER